jgi:predicted transcriptional regulator
MCNQAWVNMRSEKKPGKGRPMKIYSLAVPVDEIISYYEDKIYKQSQATISAIKKLKMMSKQVSLTTSE